MRVDSIPIPTADSDEFWEGCRKGFLTMPVCRTCGEINWFPRAMCRNCSGVDLHWERMSGEAVVYSCTVVEQRTKEGVESYVLALVDLVEGIRMMTHVTNTPPEDVKIGMFVTVRFERVSDEISLPVFVPIEALA